MEPYYLGAYWGSRQESSLRCGERFAHCVARLSEIDEILGSWFRRGASKAAAKTPVELDAESIGRLLAQGRNRRDVDEEVIEELGFSFGMWNRATPTVGLSGTVGAHPSFSGVLNHFVLDFPPPDAEARRLYDPNVARSIFDAVVEAWEPEWATWSTPALRGVQGVEAQEPVVGWMTYLNVKVREDLLDDASLRSLVGGTAITIGKTAGDATPHAVSELRKRLKHAGTLAPIR